MKVAKTRHVCANYRRQWLITGVFALASFFFFIWYHDMRGKEFSLLTTEKCTAIAAVYCIALALALGPLSRFYSGCANLLPYRRTLGLTAAVMAIPHVLLVVFYLPLKFPNEYSKAYPYSWFVTHWFTIAIGLAALLLLWLIAAYSFPAGMRNLGTRKWLILQKFAYLAMILIVLHLLSMGKIPKNWIDWLQTRDKPLPPGSFPTMVACLGALLLKVVDLVVHGDSLVIRPIEIETPATVRRTQASALGAGDRER